MPATSNESGIVWWVILPNARAVLVGSKSNASASAEQRKQDYDDDDE